MRTDALHPIGAGLRRRVAERRRLGRHVTVLAALRRRRAVDRARALPADRAREPRVEVVLPAEPATVGHLLGETDAMAAAAEVRRRQDRRSQARGVRGAALGGPRVEPRREATVAAARRVVGDRVAGQADDAGLRLARALIDLGVDAARRDERGIVAAGAEAAGWKAAHLAELLDRARVVRVVERGEAMGRARPLRRRVGVTRGALRDADRVARPEPLPLDGARDLGAIDVVEGVGPEQADDRFLALWDKVSCGRGRDLRGQRDTCDERAHGYGVEGARRGGGCPAMPSVGTGDRTTFFSCTRPRGASAMPLAAIA